MRKAAAVLGLAAVLLVCACDPKTPPMPPKPPQPITQASPPLL